MTAGPRRLLARYGHVNWALADQALVSGVNFLTGILLARFLGLEDFGRFTLAWMAVQFLNSIQHAMINAPMMSIGPKQAAGDAPAYFGAVLVQQAAFAALGFALLWAGAVASGAVAPDWRLGAVALPMAAAGAAFQAQDHLRRVFFTQGRPGAAFVSDALRYGGQLVLIVALAAAGDLDAAAALWVIAGVAGLAFAVSFPLAARIAWRSEVFAATLARHWRFARWLGASALMHWLSANIYTLIAGALLGAGAVGALRAAQNLMGVMHIVFQGLENVVPARAVRHLRDGGVSALGGFLVRLGGAMVAVTAVVALIAAAAPAFWLELLYGPGFAGYGDVLRWYAAIYVVLALALPLRAGLNALEDTKPIFIANLAAFIFAALGCYGFVKVFGLFGALYGMFTMYALMQIVLARGLHRALARARIRAHA